jgi:microcystin-dependent protein
MDEYLGIIKMFAGNFAPRGWAFCDGSILPISQNSALFSLLGTMYGGNGQTTFGLPDLRGRVALGVGTGPGLSNYTQGQMAGVENTVLNINQMPMHNHTVQQVSVQGQAKIRISDAEGDAAGGKNRGIAQGAAVLPNTNNVRPQLYQNSPAYTENNTLDLNTVDTSELVVPAASTTNAGGSLPLSIVQPFLVINFIICVEGIYPSRP